MQKLNEKNKKEILKKHFFLLLFALIFTAVGTFLFLKGPAKKMHMDAQIEAYDVIIDYREERVEYSDEYGDYYEYETSYSPIYYYMVDDISYEYQVGIWSSNDWNMESKRMIYYSSENPGDCVSEYEIGKYLILSIILMTIGGLLVIGDIISFIRTIFLGKSLVH